jgi:ribosomal protein S18 acetylase RimI-like enzyme
VTALKLRDASAKDTEVVLDFCRATWPEYGDYIPRVWRRWLRKLQGRLIVAELDGRPVGIAKVTELDCGEIWLEGLRVDPRYRHEGIAKALNREVIRTARRMRPKAVRFATGMTNRAPRHMAEQAGFKVAARLRYYWQKSRRGRVRGEPASRRDAPALYDFILASRFLRLTSGLIGEGWILRVFSSGLLARYIREKRVRVIWDAGAIKGAAIYPYEENDLSLTLGFVDGDETAIKKLARDCMYLAALQGSRFCSVAVPTRGYARIAEEAGYRRKGSVGQVVYELRGANLRRSIPGRNP